MPDRLAGLHHVTAIASDPQRNINFYTGILGLRLVKITVNFDDPATYHLYYGDYAGAPGTILTFFAWPDADQGRIGTGQFGSLTFAIPPGSLGYWLDRLVTRNVPHELPTIRFGERVLTFKDPDGLAVELVADPTADPLIEGIEHPIANDVPPEHAIQRIRGVSLLEASPGRSESLFTDHLGFAPDGEDAIRRRFSIGSGAATASVDLVRAAGFWEGNVAVGTIHHVAWQARDNAEQAAWSTKLVDAGIGVTPIRDRFYFKSIYFNEPGGARLEIATNGPGFAVDEPLAHLGQHLALPPWLESSRSAITPRLPPIVHPDTRTWNDTAGSAVDRFHDHAERDSQ
jgi:catechol 2,3-dioxygenase-like lactoylglutathione lyase family enzyme